MIEIINAPFPERISFGARSEPEWMTELAENTSGFELSNQLWEDARHRYDVSLAIRTASDYKDVRAHFNTVRGRAKGFLFKDPLDYLASNTEGVCAESETETDGFEFFKRYGSGADLYDRRITRLVSGSVTIFRTRGMTTTDVTSSSTIDHTDGTFTVSGDVNGDVYSWSGEFRVPVRYDVDRLPSAIVNKEPGQYGELFVSCDSIPLVEVRE